MTLFAKKVQSKNAKGTKQGEASGSKQPFFVREKALAEKAVNFPTGPYGPQVGFADWAQSRFGRDLDFHK